MMLHIAVAYWYYCILYGILILLHIILHIVYFDVAYYVHFEKVYVHFQRQMKSIHRFHLQVKSILWYGIWSCILIVHRILHIENFDVAHCISCILWYCLLRALWYFVYFRIAQDTYFYIASSLGILVVLSRCIWHHTCMYHFHMVFFKLHITCTIHMPVRKENDSRRGRG